MVHFDTIFELIKYFKVEDEGYRNFYLLKFGFWNFSYSPILSWSERNGNKQKNAQANSDAACLCDIVTEWFVPVCNKGGG